MTVLTPSQQKQASSSLSGDSEARRALSRQHAKDIMEYTRQLHAKDRDIDALKKKLAKVSDVMGSVHYGRYMGMMMSSPAREEQPSEAGALS